MWYHKTTNVIPLFKTFEYFSKPLYFILIFLKSNDCWNGTRNRLTFLQLFDIFEGLFETHFDQFEMVLYRYVVLNDQLLKPFKTFSKGFKSCQNWSKNEVEKGRFLVGSDQKPVLDFSKTFQDSLKQVLKSFIVL